MRTSGGRGGARAALWGVVLAGWAGGCAQPMPLGVYRVPLAAGGGVELRTLLAQHDGPVLFLHDSHSGELLGQGVATFRWSGEPEPIEFEGESLAGLTLYVRDGVFEESGERPYRKTPLPAVAPDTSSVRRVTLVAGADTAELVEVEGTLFAETARAQPDPAVPPPVLSALLSVAGAGFTLPRDAKARVQWRDAMAELVPPDPTAAIPCGAPFTSLYRPRAVEPVDVPAGRLEAVPIFEVVDVCKAPNPPELKVYDVMRRYAPGIGPVSVVVITSDAKTWKFRLVSHTVPPSGDALWPLVEGASWTYEIVDAADVSVAPPVTVSVGSIVVVVPAP